VFLAILAAWEERLRQEECCQILAGKKVLEILPPGVSKGSAIRDILVMPGFLKFYPVYFGDDTTDESAFQLLHDLGLTVKVGRTGIHTAASHLLPNPKSVRQFLARLAFPSEDCLWEKF
jgi:trehalose 6-phosphate phosphatase